VALVLSALERSIPAATSIASKVPISSMSAGPPSGDGVTLIRSISARAASRASVGAPTASTSFKRRAQS